jgi:GNAT superfamily N-acetyltransferase
LQRSTPELRFELDPQLDDTLARLLTEIWTDVSNAGGAVGFAPPVTFEDVEPLAHKTFGRVKAGDDHLVVAFSGEVPVGFLFLERRPGKLFRHWATIKRLQVHPSQQRRGIGAELLEAAHAFARDLGLEDLHLTVRGATGTETFYERHGYELKARLPNVIRVAPDDTRDELYMIKKL